MYLCTMYIDAYIYIYTYTYIRTVHVYIITIMVHRDHQIVVYKECTAEIAHTSFMYSHHEAEVDVEFRDFQYFIFSKSHSFILNIMPNIQYSSHWLVHAFGIFEFQYTLIHLYIYTYIHIYIYTYIRI